MTAPEEIIGDADVIRVHGRANFGNMTPRDVVNEGVLKYAYGYSTGFTQLSILLEHRLIYKPRPGKYSSRLTKRGMAYLRAAWPIERTKATTLSAAALAAKDAEIARLKKQVQEQALDALIAGALVDGTSARAQTLAAQVEKLRGALARIRRLARLVAHDLQGRVEAGKVAAVQNCADIADAELTGEKG